MIDRILVAVDDSPPGLAAASLAVRLTAQLRVSLRLVHVVPDGVRRSDASHSPVEPGRQSDAAQALFRHIRGMAEDAGTAIETVELTGEPAQQILQLARRWPADLIVIGRGLERGVGGPYVGRTTRMVLEFADQPVLVVPAPDAARTRQP